MQYDDADIRFSTVFATLRRNIRETHLHFSSLVPCSTGRRGCRHTKDAAIANPAARAIFLPETNARLFLSVESNRVGSARRVVDTRAGKHTARTACAREAVKLTPCGRTFLLCHVSDAPPSSHL